MCVKCGKNLKLRNSKFKKKKKNIDCLRGILTRVAENEPKMWGSHTLRSIKFGIPLYFMMFETQVFCVKLDPWSVHNRPVCLTGEINLPIICPKCC